MTSRAPRGAANGAIRITTVAKVVGGEWFDRMEAGIDRFAVENGTRSTMIGADDISVDKQVALIDGLIAERHAAITVVPNSVAGVEDVLAKARSAGIVVVTHEAGTQVNTDVDIEAFDNAAYGAMMLDRLAELMGGAGRFVCFLGQSDAQSHLDWIGGARARVAAYPGLELVEPPIETFEKASYAYEASLRILRERPDITGFLGTGSTDVVGVGQAVRETGRQAEVSVVGTSIPSMAGEYLPDGAVDRIFFWDPALAGMAQHRLAMLLLSGERIVEGLDLGIPGYGHLRRSTEGPSTFHGDAWIEVDRATAGDHPF